MFKRTIPSIAAVATVVACIAPAAQGTPTKHQLRWTIRDAAIISQGDQPGDRQSTAGLVSGSPFGHAVESITDKVTSASSSNITFKGTITIYTSHGTVTATLQIKVTPTPAGGATGTGSGTITGATGSYQRARGNFTFTGKESSNSPVFVIHATGTASY